MQRDALSSSACNRRSRSTAAIVHRSASTARQPVACRAHAHRWAQGRPAAVRDPGHAIDAVDEAAAESALFLHTKSLAPAASAASRSSESSSTVSQDGPCRSENSGAARTRRSSSNPSSSGHRRASRDEHVEDRLLEQLPACCAVYRDLHLVARRRQQVLGSEARERPSRRPRGCGEAAVSGAVVVLDARA